MKGVDLISAIALYEAISGMIPYEFIDSSWLIEDCLRGNKFVQSRLKRALDIVLGSVFFIATLPLVAVLVALIKITMGGDPFFVQGRVGRLGKPFKIYKLRTMIPGAVGEPADAEGWHEKNEDRITRLGGFLRKYHLDELPQFYNVIKGDMSIVGPRPEMEMFIRDCEKKIPFYRLRLAVKPGITGWAQIRFLHTSTLIGYQEKFRYDLYYLSNQTFRLDLEIIVRTILRLVGFPRIKPPQS